MPDLSALVGALAVVVVVVFMGWFALGTQRNIRLGNDVLRWLQEGLPLLGRRTTMRWLGSSAVELRIADAAEPFREATVLVVLEPRDIGLLWAWARLRGRRDFVIIRADLRSAPRVGVDAWDPEGWTGRPSPEGADWEPVEWSIAGVEARASAGSDPAPVGDARRLADQRPAGGPAPRGPSPGTQPGRPGAPAARAAPRPGPGARGTPLTGGGPARRAGPRHARPGRSHG
jgi:hypothetical protein